MDESQRFRRWFEEATGNQPYAYQRSLAEATHPPSVVAVPTGSGKTQALLGAWLFQRRRGAAPRRLVYALPMRSLVEQTAAVAREMRERLELSPDALPIHVLMGGEEPAKDDWRRQPERAQILIGTIDMLLSRALNRGYAESRFAWPVSFGLLNADCRWVFDEVQLMGPARATSAQLDGLRVALGTTLSCETVWVSATVDRDALLTVDRPDLGEVLSLPGEDRGGPLAGRLDARKVLERVGWEERKPAAVADLALSRHAAGTRTLVVLNTVERAQATFAELCRSSGEGQPRAVLLHSRFRPPDRRAAMGAALADPTDAGTIVVSTQVVEAGVDVSARTLITEHAPFSSVVQRLGRCNRAGEYREAHVLWLDAGDPPDGAAGKKAAAPYQPADIQATREALLSLEGQSLSPSALEAIEVPESADDPTVLRRRDLLDLFDTSPDLSGMDIDIAPFIREDDERTVSIFFRDLGKDPEARRNDDLPGRDEIVQVPLTGLSKRSCWTIDHVDGAWLRGPVAPGATVMLDASEGGYSTENGWDPKSKKPVGPLPIADCEGPRGIGSDYQSTERGDPQELRAHLQEVAGEASGLATALDLDEWREALAAAGALHDVGKAHAVFQRMLLKAIDPAAHPGADGKLWAKSGGHGGRHERPYFRHELASALALASLDGAIEVPRKDLTTYLVAAHHGKVRLSIRPAPGEEPPAGAGEDARFALGVVDGDPLPEVQTPIGTTPAVTLDLSPMELGADRSWTDAAVLLRDDPELGPFRLGFLEALLRVADWRASA